MAIEPSKRVRRLPLVQMFFSNLRTGKEIIFRFWLSEDKADTASRSRSQPKMEDNFFTSP